MNVEWRECWCGPMPLCSSTRAISERVSEASRPDAAALKAYLAVSGDLERWRGSIAWQPIDRDNGDPDTWGELVVSRADSGEIIYLEPALFWERVHRCFRARGVQLQHVAQWNNTIRPTRVASAPLTSWRASGMSGQRLKGPEVDAIPACQAWDPGRIVDSDGY